MANHGHQWRRNSVWIPAPECNAQSERLESVLEGSPSREDRGLPSAVTGRYGPDFGDDNRGNPSFRRWKSSFRCAEAST